MPRKLFQLELLLGGLGGGAPQAPAPKVREIKVTEEVLNALVRQAQDWIRRDESFLAKLREKVGPGGDITPLVETAAKAAAAELRQRLSNVVVTGFWPLAESVLQAVVRGEIAAVAGLESLDLTASPDSALASLGLKLSEEVQAMSRIASLSELFEGRAAFVRDVVGEAFLKGARPTELLGELVAFARTYMSRKALADGRERVLQFCTSLLLQGRIHRFEVKELEGLLRALEEDPLPRARLEAGIKALAERLGRGGRLRELQTPIGGDG